MASAQDEKAYTSVVTIEDSSKAGTPLAQGSAQNISKHGTTISTSDGGTLHVQPFRSRDSKQLKAMVTFVPRSSHFDAGSGYGTDQFRGFYTLFWIFCMLLSVKTIVYHHEETGSPLSLNFASLISKDLFTLFISEGVLTFTSLGAVLLVKAFKHGYTLLLTGVILQHLYQTAMLAGAITWTFNRQWPWVQSGYFTLRCLVLLMKMHSYMAVNGYLQEVDFRATKVEKKLREAARHVGGWDQAMADAKARREELDQMDTTPSETPALVKPGASYFTPPAAAALRNRLQSLDVPAQLKRNVSGTSLQSEASSQAQPAPAALAATSAVEPTLAAPHPLVDHPDKNIASLAHDLSELEVDLISTGKNKIRWPANLTWGNYIDYQLLPTLVYELEYPRTDRIRPIYVIEKTIATFGTFFLLYQYTEHYIMPHIPGVNQSFFRSLLDLALPFMVCYLILFYLIFECICNGFAELSRFADRQFYEDWWNSTSWDQFARKHVYASTLSYKSMRKTHAAFLTFLLSACVHELVMAVVTQKIRPYLFLLQMSQLPLIALGRVPIIKRNKVAGNVVFWLGLMAGFPLLCVAYCAY